MHKYTNALIGETSPYLMQHVHNPVDWHAWGPEAMRKAKEYDKPILVSIGYAACHWCHVMERESFENEEVARLMNEHFINIKIDREERPDLDHIYMDAVQAMTGSGGWPLNVFLLPDGKPFYGGTYYPPVNAHGRSSWTEILKAVSHAYQNKKNEMQSQAENLTAHLMSASAFGNTKTSEDFFEKKALEEITVNLLKNADKTWGGFGAAPKFPQTFSIQFLLRQYHFTGNDEALKQALLSLDKMIYGGIYDQLGGGFARYSTDEKWLAPHFEKMLYDNALLLTVLSETYQLTGLDLYKKIITQTIDFIQREMMSIEGGFYSALDADSEGVEGKFYTWSQDEIYEILNEDATLFCEFYGIREEGNWEHTNILWITKPHEEFAVENRIQLPNFLLFLDNCHQKLMAVRSHRVRPLTDDKILLGWNALMNVACCKAYAATGIDVCRLMAEKNMTFMEAAFAVEKTGMWFHTYKNGVAKYPAFLDDYAYLVSAYIHLQEITGKEQYLLHAQKISQMVIDHFGEEETGFFYYTGKTQTDVILRKKEVYDGAIPSGNSVFAVNLHYLSVIFDKADWLHHAQKMLKNLGHAMVKYPTSFGNWGCLLQYLVYGAPELILTGHSVALSLPEVLKLYIPGKILLSGNKELEQFPLLKGKDFNNGLFIYVCRNYACEKPVKTVAEIKSLLK